MGVYQNAFVYLNNAFVGKHPYGYSNFYLNLTNYVKFGEENVITVIVKNAVPSGRWYTGGGIYRDVNLMIADQMHFVPEGIHLSTESIEYGENGYALVRCEAAIEYTGHGVLPVELNISLLDEEGACAGSGVMPVTVPGAGKQQYLQRILVKNPGLWSAEHPFLYRYEAAIKASDGTILDEEAGNFGIRELKLDPVQGLRVNGEPVLLRGGCFHHDSGILGTANFPMQRNSASGG